MVLFNTNAFRINEFLSLRLENGVSNIYVKGRLFNQCKYLLLNIPVNRIEEYDEIESIDEAEITLNRSMENDHSRVPPETEFWGHCSNLQAWADNGYDTRLLHRNLAFPLLRVLSEQGDPQAKKVFKEEIAARFSTGHASVMTYLFNENYLVYLDAEELESLLASTEEITPNMRQKIHNLMVNKILMSETPNKLKIWNLLFQSKDVNENLLEVMKRRSPNELSEALMELMDTYEEGRLDMNLHLWVETNLVSLVIPHLQGDHLSHLLDNPNSILHYYFLKAGKSHFPLIDGDKLELINANLWNLRLLKDVEYPEKLRRLIINDSDLIDMHTIGKFTELEELSLQNNNITKIDGLRKLVKLRKLQLQDNNITNISDLQVLTKLTHLNLENNEIYHYRGIEHLRNLEYLNLASNKISQLRDLSGLKNLKTVELSNNNIGDLDCSKLPLTESIDLTQNPIVSIRNHHNRFCISCPVTFIISLLLSDEKIFIKVKDKSVLLLTNDKVLTNHDGYWYQASEVKNNYPGLATLEAIPSNIHNPVIEIDELYLSQFSSYYAEENILERKLTELYSTLQAWVDKNYSTHILRKQIALPLLKELKNSHALIGTT